MLDRRLSEENLLSSSEVHDISDLPESVDWTHMLTPVKEQGMCGSCFAVATVETLEAHAAITTGKRSDLSIQQILDCIKYTDTLRGCSGGEPEQAIFHNISHSIIQITNTPT